ncbi:hypothetical protein ACQCT6_02165 [Cytobacillus gottheilii]|uniref:Uncharacterized protein n=1 Tax=Cytobacillus gottheilii TaxID=859144 RepID=A0ABX8F891_9BACI|nr:hypothetical protein [Cytobacillus gottheilii]QVY60345.1 hypothetical protein J1899_15135 [Cytobacillus gottheilii]
MNTNSLRITDHDPLYESVNRKLRMFPGIRVDGVTYWLNGGLQQTLHEIGLSIHVKELHIHSKVRYYKVYVTNHYPFSRKVNVLLQYKHETHSREHVSFVSPVDNLVYHLADQTVYLVNGYLENEKMSECTIQPYWNIHTDNIWAESASGRLKYLPMVKGNAVSLYTKEIEFDGRQTCEGESWIISGSSKTELQNLNSVLLKNTLAFQTKK